MKRSIMVLLCGAVVSLLVLPASGLAQAQNQDNGTTPGINQRQRNERARIRQGVKSGQITRQEAARLKAEEARIRANERRARSNGNVTAQERRRLQKELNRTSKNINRQKHDNQTLN